MEGMEGGAKGVGEGEGGVRRCEGCVSWTVAIDWRAGWNGLGVGLDGDWAVPDALGVLIVCAVGERYCEG